MKKTKMIPSIFALTATLVAAIIGLVKHFETIKFLVVLLIVLLVFFFLGTIAKEVLEMVRMPDPDAVSAEGEVIEKESESEEGQETTKSEDTKEAAATGKK